MRAFGLLLLLASVTGCESHVGHAGESTKSKQEPLQAKEENTQEATKAFDLRSLPPKVRGDALRLLKQNICYCGCAKTVFACLNEPQACDCVRCSKTMADFIFRAYQSGASTQEVETELVAGFSEGFNQARPFSFDLKKYPSLGMADAPITIIEFADFMCPHCKESLETVDSLLKDHKNIRLIYVPYSLSPDPKNPRFRAAELAEEAQNQGKFWPVMKKLFEHQHELSDGTLTQIAKESGLNMKKVESALSKGTYAAKVRENRNLGQKAGLDGTPSFFINGRKLGFARSKENFEMRIEMEMHRNKCD